MEDWSRQRSASGSDRPAPFPPLGRGLVIAAVVMLLVALSRGHFSRGTIIVSGLAVAYLISYGTYALAKAVWRETQSLLSRSRPGVRAFPAVPPPSMNLSVSPPPLERETLPTVKTRDRWATWTSTAAVAPLVILPLTAGIVWLQPSLFQAQQGMVDAGPLAFFAGTAILATWVLSGVMSLFGGGVIDPSGRRISLGLAGAGIGVVAAFLGEWLLGTPLLPEGIKGFQHLGERSLITWDRHPNGLAFALYFASLAASIRWWRQSTVSRPGRFQVVPLIFSTLAAYGWTFVWPIPQEWGVMWGAVISATLQIASPWSATSPRSQQA